MSGGSAPAAAVDPVLGRAVRALDRTGLTVFAGPSLVGSALGEAASHLCLPPIRDGELAALVASERPPSVVLLVDGYFGAGQAVNLTEIQHALRSGVRMYGCSSMGALRAVEARPWGFVGLGEVFADYLTGRRTEDENVVLLHDEDYHALTVPTVNVDRLCLLLADHGVPAAACREFRRRAAAQYFGDRSFSALRVLARECLPEDGAEFALHCLEPGQRRAWDVKRSDAENAIADLVLGRAPRSVPTRLVPVPEHLASIPGDG